MEVAWPEGIAIVAALFVATGMALFLALLAVGVGTVFDARLNISVLHWFMVGPETAANLDLLNSGEFKLLTRRVLPNHKCVAV